MLGGGFGEKQYEALCKICLKVSDFASDRHFRKGFSKLKFILPCTRLFELVSHHIQLVQVILEWTFLPCTMYTSNCVNIIIELEL